MATQPRTRTTLRTIPVTLVLERGGWARRWSIPAGAVVLLGAAVLAFAALGVVSLAQFITGSGPAQAAGSAAQLAGLRTTIDNMTSRRMLDQNRWDAAMEELRRRQARLENRQSAVMNLLQGRTAPSHEPGSSPTPVGSAPGSTSAVLPSGDTQLHWGPLRGTSPRAEADVKGTIDRTVDLEAMNASLASAEVDLIDLLTRAGGRAQAQATRWSQAAVLLGLRNDRLAGPEQPKGGPLVPLAATGEFGPFETALAMARDQIAEADAWRRRLASLPLRRPLAGEPDPTSGFGPRFDPFTRALAHHAGIDFRDDWGAPVHAAAPGRVIAAEWSGAYGQMVDVAHAGGVTTRYAHLSAMSVSVGDTVPTGAIIGQVGSTGRSTGPHLHYEIRVDGEAVDPQRWLRAANVLQLER